MTRTITGTIDAWIGSHDNPEALYGGDEQQALDEISFSRYDMRDMGWTHVGTAQMTISVVDAKQIIENKVQALRAEQTKVRADAQANVTRLEQKIQQLLAIEHTPEGGEA